MPEDLRRRMAGRVVGAGLSSIDELKRAAIRLDLQRFVDELVQDFARRMDHNLSMRLAVDDAWLSDLILESEEADEFTDITVKEALARVMALAVEGANAVVLALGSSGDYELRAVYLDGKTGLALVSPDHTITGERVIRDFGGLRVSGELYKL